jgi:hypothetical protein
MLHPGRVLEAFYPDMAQVREQQPAHGDAFFDVLLLGGSTLNRESGAVEQSLRESLARSGYRNVRIFNLGYPAQGSRDSLVKYQAMADARFEVVIDYDGFNDVRVNNAPASVYRADYSHYGWYDVINRIVPSHGKANFSLPYTLTYLGAKIRQQRNADQYMGRTSRPRTDWLEYGQMIRSPESLRHNLSGIASLAAARGDRMVFMSFASHIPDNYSLKAFNAHELDYGLYYSELEIWGQPKNVVETLRQHNLVLREVAASNPQAVFVDQERLLNGNAGFFNDACHLTVAGSAQFATNITQALGAPKVVTAESVRAAQPAREISRL